MEFETPSSVFALVRERARRDPNSVALLAGGSPTTYAVLSEHVQHVAGWLRAHGIGPTDRVALVVEGGPEAASAFLGISSAAVCAPLNPSYRSAELEFYLSDLRARAVVVSSAVDTPARNIARLLGIEVLDLVADPLAPAGMFGFEGAAGNAADSLPERDAEALVLHTSGTTARPKIVALTHRNLMASARNIGKTLDLQPADRCLNVMPLFHIHGLVAALLASLWAGGSVACAPGFHQLRFFEWLKNMSPTWTTAVPTMYQMILERVRQNPRLLGGHTLRFVRSSSAALPVPVLEGIEDVLGVPMVEAYGMTEAAHQMTSSPLPPGVRKPGSVGLRAGPKIAILDAAGRSLPPGDVGEVAIRGENVFAGYESSTEANASAFVNGWFRTGDQGRLDDDGYLVLLGRLKEIINRAGEKISPLEMDEVLLGHPAVAEAVTFGMAHDRLGEEVAAAVVVREGEVLAARELQDFVAQTVAPFKVPRWIVMVDEIPKGATGKVQRLSLADRLKAAGVDEQNPDRGRSPFLEESLRTIWAEVLGIPEVEPLDDFFALGGDSILGAEAVARVRDFVGRRDLPLVAIVRAPTPRAMAAEVENQFGWNGHGVLTIQVGDESSQPLFVVHGVDGDVVRFAPIARLIDPNRPVFGLRAPGHAPGVAPAQDVESLAAGYLEGMRDAQAEGTYLIAAFCMGAAVAVELTHRLESEGESVRLLLIDPRLRRPSGMRYALWLLPRRARQRQLAKAVYRRFRHRSPTSHQPTPDRGPVWEALETAREAYVCRPISAPVALLRSEDFERFEMADWYLRAVFRRTVFAENIPGQHIDLFRSPGIMGLHAAMTRAMSHLEST